jgi:hypothetical protein
VEIGPKKSKIKENSRARGLSRSERRIVFAARAAQATGRLGRFGPVGSDFFFSFSVFLFLS